MWNQLVPGLARSYRVIRFDFRGYGESPPATEPYRQIDDLAAVLHLHGIERAHLVGASMGGAVALDFALAQPNRVLSLSLLAPGLSGYDFSSAIEAYWEAEEAALERGDIEATIEVNLDVWVRGNGREWTERSLAVAAELRDALRIIATNQSVVTNPSAAEDHELATEPARPRLAEITAPALVVIAESDPVDLVAIGELLGASLPAAEVVRMPDTAHLPALERPAETLARLLNFLNNGVRSAPMSG